MFNFKDLPAICSTTIPTYFFFYMVLVVLISPSTVLAQQHPCKNAVKHLRGDLDVVMNRGGLWSLLEQKGLKDDSTIGMIADGKLARLVGQFETLCEGEKKPTKELFILIQNLLGDARVIFNPRSSGEDMIKSIQKLIKDAEALIAKTN